MGRLIRGNTWGAGALGMLGLLASACGDDAPGAISETGVPASTSQTGTTTDGDTETGGATDAETETGVLPEPDPLSGVADLHLHMFAEEAFGGGWLHGTHDGPGASALGPCDGGNPGDHGRLREDLAPLLGTCEDITLEELAEMVPVVNGIVNGGGVGVGEFIGQVPGSLGDTGSHVDRTQGFPDFEGWPRWDTIAHQQVWGEHLKEAYDDGLRVEVISAVSLDWLCRALPDENVTRPQCNEMDDVFAQLEMANAFADANDWLEIALTPEDTRRIVEEDRMAIILSVEASHIMGEGDWRPQLDELYAQGVRTLQPVHQLNNRFGGAAPHNDIFQVAQYAENCHIDTDCGLTTGTMTLGFDVDAECRNVLGLTDEGKELIEEMIDRGMLIDAAHMSEKAVNDLYEILQAHEYYPFYLSHAHFREIMIPTKASEEKTTPWWVAQMVRQTGGMIGLRTAHEETNTYEPSPVDNTCHGSSRSFAQAYDFGRLGLKVPMGLGSDLNGFIQQTRPRFGPQACSASFPEEALCQARDERNEGVAGLGTDFDELGMAHMGVVLDLLDDLDALGTDTSQLRSSANDFVRMWERVVEPRNGPKTAADDIDIDGVVIEPVHVIRQDDLPEECNIHYCAAALFSGDECRFDAQCESGVCEGAGGCGTPRGVCE